MPFLQFLQNISFFEGLEREKSLFLSRATRLDVKKGELLFSRGEVVSSCYYMEKGLVTIFDVTQSGKEPIFFFRRTGEMFGLAEIFSGKIRRTNARALMASTVYAMDITNFRELMQREFPIAERVINVLGNRLRFLSDHICGLTTMTVRQRLLRLLAYLLYDNLPHAERDQDSHVRFRLPVSQEQMAAMIASTQPTISSTFQQLQKEGLLQITRGTIEIPSLRKLFEAAM